MLRARLWRCSMYSLACGLKDWKQRDWHSCAEVVCYDLLWTDVKKYKVVFILGLRVGVLHVTILVRGL